MGGLFWKIMYQTIQLNPLTSLNLPATATVTSRSFCMVLSLIGLVKVLLFKNPALQAQYQQLFKVLKYVI